MKKFFCILSLMVGAIVMPVSVQAADLSDASMENPVRLKKLGYISAGDSGEERIVSGQCIQIATGAPLPRGADTTVMKEDIELEDSNVLFFQAIPKSENIRLNMFLDLVNIFLVNLVTKKFGKRKYFYQIFFDKELDT